MKLYQQLANDLTVLIRQGALKPGDRVPSVRETSRERGMSPATVIHAYELLEGQGFIETRPRSGYYVGNEWSAPAQQPRARQMDPWSPGDLVAIESPAFYGCLQAVEALGLKAIEIPTHPIHGIDLAYLTRVLDKHPVRACWFMASFQNPLGALVPDEARKELVQLLELHDVPLIEDDVYAELYFGSKRPRSTKAFDPKGLVLNCDVHRKALEQGFGIAPGPIFSARREFAHCLRLNYGHEWTAASERAIKTLGAIVRS